MQEMVGSHEDILFDLEQIKLLSQQKVNLTDEQKDRVGQLPKSKQEQIEKEILSEKEREKKTFLRIWTLELEDKVKQSDLPREVVAQILELTAYAKDRDMTFIYNIERKIDTLREQVKEAEQKKAMEEAQKKDAPHLDKMVVGAVVAGVALAPFVQVRYDKEEFEKRTTSYYEDKIISNLANAAVEPIKLIEPKRTYPKKKGSLYPKAHYELKKKHQDEWMDILVRDVQKKQAAEGKPVQTAAEIAKSFENMPNMKKKITMKALETQHPECAAKQKQEEKAHDEFVLRRGIERSRRKDKKRQAKLAKFRAKQQAKAQTQTQIQTQTQGKTQTQVQAPPQKPEPVQTEEKAPEKLFKTGLSKRLADNEAAMKPVQQRVIDTSKGLSTASKDDEKRQKMQDYINKKAPDLFRRARESYYAKTG